MDSQTQPPQPGLLFLNTCNDPHPPKFARFITPPHPPIWASSVLGWEVLGLPTPGGLPLSTELVPHIPRAQVSGARWATHSSFKQSRSVVLVPMCCFTNTRNHVNVFCTFSGRAVVESPIIPPQQTMPSPGCGAEHAHTHTV